VATDERWPELDFHDLPVSLHPYDERVLTQVDLVVPSPGVPPSNEIIKEAEWRQIPILSELEVAVRFLRVPLVAVTGTNGKTTTVTLIGHILAQAGKRVFLGGNIGTPLISYVSGPQEDDWVVVEASSFQLLWTETFHPTVGILLNVTQDHLDYHGSFAAYRAAKERLFEQQGVGDVAIVNGDEEETERLKQRLRSHVITFSSRKKLPPPSIFLAGEEIYYHASEGTSERYPCSAIHLPGLHNVENCMAAIVCARECGCGEEEIRDAIASFRGIPHRIEQVAEIGGVTYVDDSKGTNCDAVKRALETFPQPLILLMGGRDKDSDFSILRPVLAKQVKQLIAFGEARMRIAEMVAGSVPVISTPTLREAVTQAKAIAGSGDIVLLSPGCASFDEFRDYRERGIMFRRWVEEEGHGEMD